MKYNWTIDTLENRYNKILKLLKTETNQEKFELLQKDLSNLLEEIEIYKDNSSTQCDKLLNCYNETKNIYNEIKFIWEDIKEFKEFTKKPLGELPDIKKHSLSTQEILDLTHDIYKECTNSFFYGNFMKNFYRRKDHIRFLNNPTDAIKGYTISIPSLKESFILIQKDHTLEDVLTTTHEYSHAISALINPYHILENKKLFCEIDSIFMELIGSDYIEKLFKNNNGNILKASMHELYCWDASNTCQQFEIINLEKSLKNGYETNRLLKSTVRKNLFLEPLYTENLIYYHYPNNIEYIESYIFALELYRLYLEDKEKALYNLKKIILMKYDTLEEYYSNIKGLGFIPNLSLMNYHKGICEDILNLTRNKK